MILRNNVLMTLETHGNTTCTWGTAIIVSWRSGHVWLRRSTLDSGYFWWGILTVVGIPIDCSLSDDNRRSARPRDENCGSFWNNDVIKHHNDSLETTAPKQSLQQTFVLLFYVGLQLEASASNLVNVFFLGQWVEVNGVDSLQLAAMRQLDQL